MNEASEPLPLKSRAVVFLGTAFLHLLARTWRIRVVNPEVLANARAAKRGFIFALWHGQLLPLLWHHRGEGVAVLISEHRDGELVARAASSLGYSLIRGSTTRGADRALISLVRVLKDGKEVAITPDGPLGPASTFAPGALVAAQRADTFVLPVGVSARRAWHLRSWDRFLIPKPFTRLTVAYGEPARVLGTDARSAAAEGHRFEMLLNEAVSRAGG
ncbi:MAG: lysophospholipid acyltransferase family protein [Gemmatimonadaceae bacterium]